MTKMMTLYMHIFVHDIWYDLVDYNIVDYESEVTSSIPRPGFKSMNENTMEIE